jgi:hypothetical protein
MSCALIISLQPYKSLIGLAELAELAIHLSCPTDAGKFPKTWVCFSVTGVLAATC